ncbi:spore germination protein YndE [Clostridium tepidiprofundi DSM 19306]|uniref:Spore germination protein YndE n=1 Tax=Clostridium tepidiprofundi DSM 19306 TaxID=1121338 RepID=A0A151B639_9CLOT|nr:GerAB/ArcD/ProY family transporter [Clostridium tepidiprofundi]KYH35364.1 spore germination protein YndE [Clostridium tepidiprofundi DSM 19306]
MDNKLTNRQYIALILNSFIGIGIITLAGDLCKDAKQNAWISAIIGGILPLFVLLSSAYISKKLNYCEFKYIAENTYGKYLSKIIPFIFIIDSMLYIPIIVVNYTQILKTSISKFMPEFLVVLIFVSIMTYTSWHNIKVLGRLSEISIYFILSIVIVLLFFANKGDVKNLQPFATCYKDIIKAVPKSLLAYQGGEVCFFLSSYISNRKSLKKNAILITSVVTFFYAYIVFITIYFLGWELTSKTNNVLLFIFETQRLHIISDLKAVFLIFWSNSIFLTTSIFDYPMVYSLSYVFKLDYKKACLLPVPVLFLLSYISLKNDNFFKKVVKPTATIVSYILVIWVAITVIIVFFKTRGEKNA